MPYSKQLGSRLMLGMLVVATVLGRLFASVFPVPPRHAGRDLRQPGIMRLRAGRAARRLDLDLADDPLVTIALVPFDLNVLVEHEPREAGFRLVAECLRLLRRVDTHHANLVLLPLAIQDGYRISVRDTDNQSDQNVVGVRWQTGQQVDCDEATKEEHGREQPLV